jgi:hypothetical protein
MSFEESLDIVRKLSEGRIKRDPNAKVYKYIPPPVLPPALPTSVEIDEPADVVYVKDEPDDSNT